MRKYTVLLFVVFFLVQTSMAQDVNSGWGKWKFLIGKWQGEGNGQPGQGNGYFTLQEDLGGSILTRKNRTDFPATGDKPAFSHEDLMIVYKNAEGNPAQAIYFDSENHVIRYGITYAENQVILTSDAATPGPRFRLTYEKTGEEQINVKFEMAMPNAPADFKTYLEGKCRKIN